MIWQVIKTHHRTYENPVAGKTGDVFITGKLDDWQGHIWIWCTNQEGLEGWVSEHILELKDGQATLNEDFDALELSVSEGEQVTGSRQLGGWLWSNNSQNESGWVPLENLKKVSE